MSDDLLPQFLFEGRELVQQASDALLSLERAGGSPAASDRALLDRAFRAVHTLKGSTGLFDLAPMGRLLHAAEDVLDRFRGEPGGSGSVPFDALLRCLGACETWLDAIGRTGTLPADASEEARRLRDGLPGGDSAATGAIAAEPRIGAGDAMPDWVAPLLRRFAPAVADAHRDGGTLRAVRYRPTPDCFFLGDDPVALLAAVPALAGLHLEPAQPADASSDRGLADPFGCILVATLLSTATIEALQAAFRRVPDQVEIVVVPPGAMAAAPDGQQQEGTRFVRVDAERIDAVVDLAGEMLVVRNALGALVGTLARRAPELDPSLHQGLAAAHADIDRLARALRLQATALRLVPLEQLFRRLPRLLREIAASDGKQVELDLSGGAVELDRAIADRLFEPLLHVLRNAVGHGLEDRNARLASGKPATGRIAVRAVLDGQQVVVTVSDDGRGIDPERIRAAARDRALMEEARLNALDAAGCLDLLFLPGFSTATAVTELSGRGVGMDAVRAAVASMGGRVGLNSRMGAGTEVRIVLSRDVSISTVLLVGSGGERFAVPIDAIGEIVRVSPDRVSTVGGAEAFALRERVLPLLRLATLLDLPTSPADAGPATVLVAEAGGQPAGFVVDGVAGRADLMVRRLDGFLSGTRGVSGTALGPDGRVLLVLDLADLAEAAPGRGS